MAEERFVAMNTADIPWIDAGDIQELPPGQEVKILRRFDEDDYSLDTLVRFPPGYVEPRHTHEGEHMVLIVEGRMIVDGKTLGPGDYVYGPRNTPHGPMEYPDGIVLYASHRGSPVHEYEGKAEARAKSERRRGPVRSSLDSRSTVPTNSAVAAGARKTTTGFMALTTCDIAWMDAKQLIELPPGLEIKVLRHDPDDDDARDLLVRFPPGYVEPRHMHPGSHNNIILEGRMLIDGKTLGRGDYVYGPGGVWHGPFAYPDGILLCAFHRGSPVHTYEGKEKFYGKQ